MFRTFCGVINNSKKAGAASLPFKTRARFRYTVSHNFFMTDSFPASPLDSFFNLSSEERWRIFDPASAPATRALLREIGAVPNKTLGQNFLVNGQILDKIVSTAQVSVEDRVLEIGPGLGSLTCRLVRAARQVVAVEKDPPLRELLSKHLPAPNLTIIGDDALRVSWDALGLPDSGVKVVANLPYSISKPMLRRLLEEWRPHFSTLTILVQREVADRIVAQPATPEYGPMAIMAHLYSDAKRVFDVRAGSFIPPPNVLSSVVHIQIRAQPRLDLANEKFFWSVVRAAFGQRRKQLINTLRAVCDDDNRLQNALQSCDIDPKRRGETLSLQEFAALSQTIAEQDASENSAPIAPLRPKTTSAKDDFDALQI